MKNLKKKRVLLKEHQLFCKMLCKSVFEFYIDSWTEYNFQDAFKLQKQNFPNKFMMYILL